MDTSTVCVNASAGRLALAARVARSTVLSQQVMFDVEYSALNDKYIT